MKGMHDDPAVQGLVSPKTILRSFILLLLDDRPGHGYDLLVRLEPFGVERSGANKVYRTLRWLDDAGFVQPSWETTGVGPARRVYEVSPEGRLALEISSAALRRQAKSLDNELGRYLLTRLRVLSNNKQVFEFTVEAQLSVQALDEASACRKLERIFGQPNGLDSGVRATGGLTIRPMDAGVDGPG